ncbi:phospholipase A2 inhibitor gamma subunit B-like [Dendropsophus ebraccatus]|uniref:phospholipase A2 inhibitor gamma subunit B-like n=1 Tax=Dendropsophus ebraccatus TaxID=150705 RepID=UPI0038322CBC
MAGSRLLLICLLSGITAADISCVQCVGEKTCQGTEKKCPSNAESCISVLEETRIGAKLTSSVFMRLCGNCSDYKMGAIRFGKGILRINKTCCKENNCTPPEPTIPPFKPPPKDVKVKDNGVMCKSCFALSAKNCDCNNVFVNCTREETKCIARSMSASGGYNHGVALRGCTTKEMCDTFNKDLKVNTTNLKFIISCTDESDSVHKVLLPLVLAAAMFSKLTTAT